jgi:hypothetical protein
MLKLIDGKTSDFNGLASSCPTWGARILNPRHIPAEEPLRVHVRVRQYGDAAPEARQTRSGGLDPHRLPVGSLLDCYV